MDKIFTVQLRVHYDNKCNFVNKNANSNLTEYFFLLVNKKACRFVDWKNNNLSLKI